MLSQGYTRRQSCSFCLATSILDRAMASRVKVSCINESLHSDDLKSYRRSHRSMHSASVLVSPSFLLLHCGNKSQPLHALHQQWPCTLHHLMFVVMYETIDVARWNLGMHALVIGNCDIRTTCENTAPRSMLWVPTTMRVCSTESCINHTPSQPSTAGQPALHLVCPMQDVRICDESLQQPLGIWINAGRLDFSVATWPEPAGDVTPRIGISWSKQPPRQHSSGFSLKFRSIPAHQSIGWLSTKHALQHRQLVLHCTSTAAN